MKATDWFALTTELHSNPKFFARSPFQSYYFVTNTIILVLALCTGALVLVRFWGILPGPTMLSLVVPLAGMPMLWARALVDYRKVRSLYARGEIRDVPLGSPLDVALRVAASMTHFGMMYAFLMVGMLVFQLGWVLHAR